MDLERFRATLKPLPNATADSRSAALVQELRQRCARQLDVRFHRNRWVYFSWRPNGHNGCLVVRLHEAFLEAPPEVVESLAKLLTRDDSHARRIVAAFVDRQSVIWDDLSDRPPRPLRLNPKGQVYDLQVILDALNQRYFGGQCTARITWGSGARTRRRLRQITFGSYEEATNLIRIHPMLDTRKVPGFFVRYIVFHEMLHATVPPAVSPTGRRIYHTRLFQQRERTFHDYHRAQAWGQKRF